MPNKISKKFNIIVLQLLIHGNQTNINQIPHTQDINYLKNCNIYSDQYYSYKRWI